MRNGIMGMGLLLLLLVAVATGYDTPSKKSEKDKTKMTQKVKTFLMFEGKAEEAMNFYVSVFKNAKIESIHRYGAGEAGPEGSVMKAVFSIDGQQFMAIDSYVKHGFTFTPAISLFVTCDSENEIEKLFAKLSKDGQILMPLDAYPFAKKFGWVADRFGVSWQLSLPLE